MEMSFDKKVKYLPSNYTNLEEPTGLPSPEQRVRRIGPGRVLIHPDASLSSVANMANALKPDTKFVVNDFSGLVRNPKMLALLTVIGRTIALRISDSKRTVTKIAIGEQ